MDTLKDTVRAVMAGYARKGLNSHSDLTHNDDYTVLTVVTTVNGKNAPFMSLLVRILADTAVIERDQNDKRLVDALVQAGVPRSHIILAYAGEPAPETA
ncbi:MAG: XisI protein [Anaerolineae bacterium]|nr:XisI protein [Anaerolineae bacterium]